jgi:3-phosphoshikimate 1-carboxyvinyltransferase
VSSQFISALMMIAPALGGLELRIDGPVVSRGYLDMTAAVMRRFAAEVQVGIDRVSVTAAPYRATDFEIDADWSSASYPFAAAAIVGGEVSVPRLRRNDTQPEEAFVGVLEQLGCRVRIDAAGVTVTREMGTALRGVDVDMSVMSDLVPTLAAIAACANGATTIRGVGFIRSKESDRLGDLAAEINRCGGRVRVLADGLSIEPAAVTAATIDAHDDHRLAMSLALLGLRHDGVVVAEPGVVAKSWPSYWSAMRRGLSLG